MNSYCHSLVFNRKIHNENMTFSCENSTKEETIPNMNDIPFTQWFRQKTNEWKNYLKIISKNQNEELKYDCTLKFIIKANKIKR